MLYFYYFMQNIAKNFCEILKDMYDNKMPQELAIPNTLGMILQPEYQYIYFTELNQTEIKDVMTYIKKVHEQVIVYQFDYTKAYYIEEVDKYIYFMKADDY